jgi:hypothetical protein
MYLLLFLRPSSSFLRLLPRLPVTSILPFIFPSITCRRRQFLRSVWPSDVTTAVWTAAVLRCGQQTEKLPHFYFSWLIAFQKQTGILAKISGIVSLILRIEAWLNIQWIRVSHVAARGQHTAGTAENRNWLTAEGSPRPSSRRGTQQLVVWLTWLVYRVFVLLPEQWPLYPRCQLYRTLGGPHDPSGKVRKISSPTEFEPRTLPARSK